MPIRPTTANSGKTSGEKFVIARIKSNMGANNYARGGDGDPYIPDGDYTPSGDHAEETLDKIATVFIEAEIYGTPLKVLSDLGYFHVDRNGRSLIPGAKFWGHGDDRLRGGYVTIAPGHGRGGYITLWELDWSLKGSVELMAGKQCMLGKCDDSDSQGPIKVEKLIRKCVRGFGSGDSDGIGGGDHGYSTVTDFNAEGQGFERKGLRWISHHEIICCGECDPQYEGHHWSGDHLIDCKGKTFAVTPGPPSVAKRQIGAMLWNCVKDGCPKLYEGEDYRTWEDLDCDFWAKGD